MNKRIQIKNIFYKTILIFLFCAFSYFLIWGNVGILKYYATKKHVEIKKKELVLLKKEVKKINKEISHWNSDSFYLEKMAREDLCMGYPNESVYRC